MTDFALQYLIWVFFASVGMLQIVAAKNGLRGLQFSSKTGLGFLIGVLCIGGSYIWFFGSRARNVDGWESGVEGLEQGTLFLVAMLGALVFTLSITSLIHRSDINTLPLGQSGVDVLKTTTVWEAIRRSKKANTEKIPRATDS